jgi:hypothetical protein
VGNSVIKGNRGELTSALPIFAGGGVIDMNANSGGIHVGNGVPTLVENSKITDNSVAATDPAGAPVAIDGGMLVGDSPLTMRSSVIRNNAVTATIATSANGPGGGAFEVDGPATITSTLIADNPVVITSAGGLAAATAAVAVFDFSANPRLVVISGSQITGNSVHVSTATGVATVQGVGLINNGLLELRGVLIRANSGRATGAHTTAQGGGIWNGALLSGPPVELTLRGSQVTGNSLSAGAGGVVQGAGLYTTSAVTRAGFLIARNTPDQCFGC